MNILLDKKHYRVIGRRTFKKGFKIFGHKPLLYDLKVTIIKPINSDKPGEFDLKAEEFLKKNKINFEAKYLYNGPKFNDDYDNETKRDIYKITFSKDLKNDLVVDFGNSLMDSEMCPFNYTLPNNKLLYDSGWFVNARKPPSAYSVLSCLTKYEPDPVYEDWALEMGMNPDSIKGSRVHQEVLKEYKNVSQFFSFKEMKELRDIE